MKTFEVEFSAKVTLETKGDTDEIIQEAMRAFEQRLKYEMENGDIRKLFTAIILHVE